MQTEEDQRTNLRSYCLQCTDTQLVNVYEDEKARARRCPSRHSEVGNTARIFAQEARVVMAERGLFP